MPFLCKCSDNLIRSYSCIFGESLSNSIRILNIYHRVHLRLFSQQNTKNPDKITKVNPLLEEKCLCRFTMRVNMYITVLLNKYLYNPSSWIPYSLWMPYTIWYVYIWTCLNKISFWSMKQKKFLGKLFGRTPQSILRYVSVSISLKSECNASTDSTIKQQADMFGAGWKMDKSPKEEEASFHRDD